MKRQKFSPQKASNEQGNNKSLGSRNALPDSLLFTQQYEQFTFCPHHIFYKIEVFS